MSLGRVLTIQSLLESRVYSLGQIGQIITRIEQANPHTVYNIVIERNLGPLAIGDNAKAIESSLPDDVRTVLTQILNRLSVGQGSEKIGEPDKVTEQRYRAQVVKLYN